MTHYEAIDTPKRSINQPRLKGKGKYTRKCYLRENQPRHPLCPVETNQEIRPDDGKHQLSCPPVQSEHSEQEEGCDRDGVVVPSRIRGEFDVEGRERVRGEKAEDELRGDERGWSAFHDDAGRRG